MKKATLNFVILFIITIILISCYPNDSIKLKDLDTTTTVYEPNDFNPAPESAVIYWNVAQIKGDGDDDLPYHGEIDSEILNTTLDNMVDLYGAENVYIYSNTANPSPTPSNSAVKIITPNDSQPSVDAGIIPSIILRRNTQVGIIYPPCIPGWWYWYCYPPVVNISTYDVGTVLLSMVDLRQNNNDESSWIAIMRGLLSSDNSYNGDRTVSGIDKAFEQSPYLN